MIQTGTSRGELYVCATALPIVFFFLALSLVYNIDENRNYELFLQASLKRMPVVNSS